MISYFRSSSYNNHNFCEQQFYINYVLGIQQEVNIKAHKGTIVHKVLECLALGKKSLQNNTGNPIDDVCGEIDIIEMYNEKYVDNLLDKAYTYYTAYDESAFTKTDRKDVGKWLNIALTHNDGMFDPRKRDVLEPEQSFDFVINKDWAKLKEPIDGQTHLSMKGTMDLVTRVGPNLIEVVDWKGLPLDTKLPTPNGWTTMGEVQIGDLLFDKDGNQTKVLAKSQKKYKPCYKITFDDKSVVECDNEHLWMLISGDVKCITDLKINDKIDICKNINTNYIPLPIDPYVLGVWLGDDRSRSGEIANGDKEIFEEIQKRGYTLGKNISSRKNDICEQRSVVGLTTKLKELNLLNNKHIPQIYLRASYQQRLDLLRGLMDTDGNVNSIRKQCIFTNCNKQLSDNTKELILSLGQRVNQAFVKRPYQYKDGRDICYVYPLSFRALNINPFLLKRKADKINDFGIGKSNYRRIIKIDKLSIHQETQCISVDSPTNTYLCTENFIPTHNTGARKDWASGQEKDFYKLSEDPQLMLYFYAATHLYPNDSIIFTIFFLRDGGPFTVTFDNEHLQKVELMLEKKLRYIENTKLPVLVSKYHTDFKCTKLCSYYKNTYGNTNKTICDYVHEQIKAHGIAKATKKLRDKNFSVDKYKAPGSSE